MRYRLLLCLVALLGLHGGARADIAYFLQYYLSIPCPWRHGVPQVEVGHAMPPATEHPYSGVAAPEQRIFPYQAYCGYPHTFWLSAEFVSWWMSDGRLPPLVTAGPAGSSAVLGEPGTVLLYGGSRADLDPLLGGQFRGGMWFDFEQFWGIEGGFQFAAERSDNFVAFTPGGPGQPVISRPVVDVLTGQPASTASLIPDFRTGTVDIYVSTRFLGAEGHVLRNLLCFPEGRLDLLIGFRYLELEEHLEADEYGDLSAGILGTVPAVISDEFDARNRFYGGYVGVKAAWQWDRLTAEMMGRVSLGGTQQQIGITGVTGIGNLTPDGIRTTFFPGGLLAQATNAGLVDRDVFGVVPEGSLRIGYQILEHLRIHAGMSLLYWNRVVRVGEQVDLGINPNIPVPPGEPQRPALLFHDRGFWLFGLSAGLEVRY
ncbi:MAG: BBP7 family outer membrane beta-barrel protein [Gemmatales bacterium]|nr:BBP7 family outer membrane beta-barrel protein [Gemmatales bacterium]MDW8386300.1 BBP7 family outer membrane beta-barrel protein [Gemmatales bacterium]